MNNKDIYRLIILRYMSSVVLIDAIINLTFIDSYLSSTKETKTTVFGLGQDRYYYKYHIRDYHNTAPFLLRKLFKLLERL